MEYKHLIFPGVRRANAGIFLGWQVLPRLCSVVHKSCLLCLTCEERCDGVCMRQFLPRPLAAWPATRQSLTPHWLRESALMAWSLPGVVANWQKPIAVSFAHESWQRYLLNKDSCWMNIHTFAMELMSVLSSLWKHYISTCYWKQIILFLSLRLCSWLKCMDNISFCCVCPLKRDSELFRVICIVCEIMLLYILNSP